MKSKTASLENIVSFAKVIPQKKIVYGIVYSPFEPDAHNHFMKSEEIENMAHRFIMASRKMDEMHDYVEGSGIPVESFIARKGDPDFPEGAWVLGTKVTDDRVWEKILSGEIKSYSMAGVAEEGEQKEMDSKWFDDDGKRNDPFN